jgi:homospermidine synthase
MRDLGVKGVQIAERDTQYTNLKRPIGHFWNTWSVQGLIDEAYIQLAEIGWGTH